jgi:hypothetical protein
MTTLTAGEVERLAGPPLVRLLLAILFSVS